MPVFEQVTRYPHPRSEVFAWHTRPGAFVRLTPPGSATALEGPTRGIRPGSELVLRISHPLVAGLLPELPLGRRGPAGLNWRVRHVEYDEGERFVDEQVSGPLRSWRHEHHFADGPGGSTVITDRIHWEPPRSLPGGLTRTAVRRFLEGFFAFRERQLRADLDLHARLGATHRRVVVAGASGLIGTQLCALLTSGGHDVVRLVRGRPAGPDEAAWDPAEGRLDAGVLDGADAVVNLSGHPIGGRFTSGHKAKLLGSRLDATATLADAVVRAGVPALVQASAIGFYGARRPGELLTEASEPGDGVLAEVVGAWEAAARPAWDAGVRVALLRTGIVLSGAGGALAPQVPLFLLGAGGRLARADAWQSWVALDDVAHAYAHALATEDVSGPVNVVAPRPVTHQQFAVALGRTLGRPALLPTPAIGPKVVLGAEGYDQLIDTDQWVGSGVLDASGFRFTHGNLTEALRHVLLC